MKFYETKSQFINLEENMTVPENIEIKNLRFSNDMNSHSSVELPDFELTIKTGGTWGFGSYLTFEFKGVSFNVKPEYDKELFIIDLLNELKRGKYETILFDLAKKSMKADDFLIFEKTLKTKNILALKLMDENKKLKTQISKLESLEKYIEEISQLKSENKNLKDILNQINSISTLNK